MSRPPLLRRRSTSAAPFSAFSRTNVPPVLMKVIVFVVAFWIGKYSAPSNDAPPSSSLDAITRNSNGQSSSTSPSPGWNSIHVFYGMTNTTTPNRWYSQVGQDELVLSLLKRKRNGYFVDLAANDAIHWSNTHALEQDPYHWNGLCIEPTPRYWNDLIVKRTCHAVGAVVGNDTSTLVQWKRRKEYSGIVGNEFDNHQVEGRSFPTKYTVSLKQVFERNNVPRTIDYLSLDVEGAEEYILNDFLLGDKYIFSIMTIERPSKSLMGILESQGYKYLATLSDWGETIWAHESVQLAANQTLLDHYKATHAPWDPYTKT